MKPACTAPSSTDANPPRHVASSSDDVAENPYFVHVSSQDSHCEICLAFMSQIRLLEFALFVTASTTMCFGGSGAQLPASESVPAGWTIYQTPTDGNDSLRCANYSQKEWRVSVSGTGKTQITPSQPQRKSSEPDLPPGVKLQRGMVGLHSSLRVSNGWLLGFDGGEFGGGLWLAASDGKAQRLSEENVHGFIETSRGVLIFVGLDHLGTDSGKVLIAPYAVTSKSDLRTLVDLDGAPGAFTKLSADTALVVTTHGISQITSAGVSKKLLSRNFGMLYPNSIVSLPDGTIYAGMRLFVVRLVLRSGDYTEEWLVPQGCEKFHVQGFDCACSK
jgi:hypothetical protein